MILILYITLYIVGSIFTFGKMTAIDYEQLEITKKNHIIGDIDFTPWYKHNSILTIIIYLGCSWLSYSFLILFFSEKKYFLKFNYKNLK